MMVLDERSPTVQQSRDDAFRLLVSRVRDYAIFLLDTSGHVMTWNEGAERIKGYKAEEIIGKHLSVFYTEEDRARGLPQTLLDAAVRNGRVEDENWRVRKNGSRFWADVVITALRDDEGHLRGFGKVTRDLTERKEAESALAELTGRLLRLQDEERHALSQDLHDTTSPVIAALTSKLYAIRQKAGDKDAVDRMAAESLTNVESVSTAIRSVSALLHPPLLDQAGLLPSLRWYLESFSKRTGMSVHVEFPDRIPRLSPSHEIVLFRVVQETLSGVSRVVHATSATVTIRSAAELGLMIKLTGSVPPVLADELKRGRSEAGIGIAGVRERVKQIGGTFDVTSAVDEITVTAVLPQGPQAR